MCHFRFLAEAQERNPGVVVIPAKNRIRFASHLTQDDLLPEFPRTQ